MYSATWAAKRAAMLWAAKYPMRAANVQQKTCSMLLPISNVLLHVFLYFTVSDSTLGLM